ncbi:MAG TPA: hypothetical protein VFP01_05745 [Propionibacteriaceae bacterium]|nr:hypothetical protein [Propionibacteriaceae bacterium]
MATGFHPDKGRERQAAVDPMHAEPGVPAGGRDAQASAEISAAVLAGFLADRVRSAGVV